MNNEELKKLFIEQFHEDPEYYVDTGGRFEICGNHTDHNHGLCLVANCSLRIMAMIKPSKDTVEIKSQGYRFFKFNVDDLELNPKDHIGTLLITKGILFRLKELGYKVGGFKAYIYSDIPDGGGVSSSAAIESLFGYIISYLYNDGKIDPLTIAKTGKYSENVYFKKPSGLLDQIGTSFDSSNFIDFENIDEPVIKTLPFDLPLTLYLIKSAGNHANLTPLYAAIPDSMYKVAGLLDNKKVLRDVTKTDECVFSRIDKLDVTDEVKRKAKHFFIENKNVEAAKKAIEEKDVEAFLSAIRASQETSKNNLENTFVKGEFIDSPQDIINKVTEFLGDKGAIRIHGGGFKGTTLSFVKNEYVDEFDEFLKKNFDPKSYFKVTISPKAVNFKKL